MNPTKRLPFHAKKIFAIAVTSLLLNGCVGVVVSLPDEEQRSHVPLTEQKTDSDLTTRAWCGVTLWAVIVPIPLKLPVCQLHVGQSLTSPFYACGPFMFLGGMSNGYEGHFLCGKFPKVS
ncbi:hypothetical protein [Pseudomonas nunensis]|uniref:hypothetical protein n=1 Tax=Pseudomonas nunensis TaxID=2961896 RepID=UPI0006B5F42C|nr:hypothetical protein [Pseudomonas nunensis]